MAKQGTAVFSKLSFSRTTGLAATVFALSAGMLSYEILLSRIASVLLTSNYLFLILAFALLGISVGALLDFFFRLPAHWSDRVDLGASLAVHGFILILTTIFLIRLGGNAGLIAIVLAAALPFASAGWILSRLFRLHTDLSGHLYAVDLIGAALGALVVPAGISLWGPTQMILLIATLQALLGIFVSLLAGIRSQMAWAIFVTVIGGGVFWANYNDALIGPVPIGRSLDKDLFRLMSSSPGEMQIVDSRWSTFGRTDLVAFERRPDSMSIFINGAAGTPMFRFDGDLEPDSTASRTLNRGFAGAFALALLRDDQRENALIIGPGGGRDILLALQAEFGKITAVEVNPQMVEIVSDYADFNGGIYNDFPHVDVHVDEGRRFLRESKERYDLITLFMPVTKSSQGLNAFALSESYLFTVEAFRDYHEHLTDEGMLLIMAHGMEEAVKLTTTAVKALSRDGMDTSEAMDHLYLLGSHMMPFFVMTKEPVSPALAEQLHMLVHLPLFDPSYSYIPGIRQEWFSPPLTASESGDVPMMNPLLYDLADGSLPLARLERGMGINLRPATDDRPFFSQFGLGPPSVVWWMSTISFLALVLIAIFPARRLARGLEREMRAALWWIPLWAVAIGVGFIVVELVLFQKILFQLGDPSRSLALLLASLLVGSGIGSLLTSRLKSWIATVSGLLSAIFAIVFSWSIPITFALLGEFPEVSKMAIAGLILLLQGLPMGMLFPIGLRVASDLLGDSAVPWMWALNGAASVFGSALTVALAMKYGYAIALVLGVGMYLLAAVAAYGANRLVVTD
jgi:hypothetical protein